MNGQLSAYTTVNAGGNADIETVTDSSRIKLRGDEIIIGRGSKLLVSDAGVRNRILVMRNEKTEVRGDVIIAESGATLPRLSRMAAEAGLSGLEWACGIPGSLGGGIIMNAGAYGGEISDILVSVDVLTADGKITVPAKELDLAYRHTYGLPAGVITSAALKLAHGDGEKIKNLTNALAEERKQAQPAGHTFGSTFKKIRDLSAGYYIEKAGLKGYRSGNARVSEKHANFIINEGASAADLRKLIDFIKLTVYNKLGERLTEEVIYIGEF